MTTTSSKLQGFNKKRQVPGRLLGGCWDAPEDDRDKHEEHVDADRRIRQRLAEIHGVGAVLVRHRQPRMLSCLRGTPAVAKEVVFAIFWGLKSPISATDVFLSSKK